eukprot:CAMPEP_0117654918 /NCGR_PEP_ID=MMETSP0804-20121206/4003_1 /TAXON_ID=1074897 /ORGANISM="Tetraselmis astigmatica, Strain CCMP880" /LENGTH=105 /DNA_ID=CAMNT_0005461237 /DNA_START=977 /DNA_END=1292 /DNA_ORIENTATION=-
MPHPRRRISGEEPEEYTQEIEAAIPVGIPGLSVPSWPLSWGLGVAKVGAAPDAHSGGSADVDAAGIFAPPQACGQREIGTGYRSADQTVDQILFCFLVGVALVAN